MDKSDADDWMVGGGTDGLSTGCLSAACTRSHTHHTHHPPPKHNRTHISLPVILAGVAANRGRVRQKAAKRTKLLELGKLMPREGWFNAGGGTGGCSALRARFPSQHPPAHADAHTLTHMPTNIDTAQTQTCIQALTCAHPSHTHPGYIFPVGFKTMTTFRSSVDLNALVVHECSIVGEGGEFWPQVGVHMHTRTHTHTSAASRAKGRVFWPLVGVQCSHT